MTREQPSPDRQARAQRLGPYFELQLRLAGRMAELSGAPLGDCVATYTNIHRRFGLGSIEAGTAAAWQAYIAGLEACDGVLAQAALTQQTFLVMPEEGAWPPPRKTFGCFGCDPPNEAGAVQIHFNNLDTDEAGGPLVHSKIPRRQAELAALVTAIGKAWPEATAIKGRSWLYNLEAYRRLFPADYAASAEPAAERISLHGNSSWGQVIDSRERVRPPVRDAIVSRLPKLDPETPWRVFPLPVLRTFAPLASFRALYGLGA